MTTTQADPLVHSAPAGYAAAGPDAVEQATPGPSRRWHGPSIARTRIVDWVLLLVLAALGVVTFVT